MAKHDNLQQTGFRADRDLLDRFRARAAAEGSDMGTVIEQLIAEYLAGARLRDFSVVRELTAEMVEDEPLTADEAILLEHVLLVVRDGEADARSLLRHTMAVLSGWQDWRR